MTTHTDSIASRGTAFAPASYFRSYSAVHPTLRERVGRQARAWIVGAQAALQCLVGAVSGSAAGGMRAMARCVGHGLRGVSEAVRNGTFRAVQRVIEFIPRVTTTLRHFQMDPSTAPWSMFPCSLQSTARAILGASLIGLSVFLSQNSNADIIRVAAPSSLSDPNVGGTEMGIGNRPGGALGYDSDDGWNWGNWPPQTPPVVLRPWSDQLNLFYGFPNHEYKLSIDNRPFDGPDKNHNFPLYLDTFPTGEGTPPQYITSSNNHVFFEMIYRDSGDDEQGRRYYQWTMQLLPVSVGSVIWADGSPSNQVKTGIWDTHQPGRHHLPYYHLDNVPLGEMYAKLDVIPVIPEPLTSGLIGLAAAGALAASRAMRKRED